MMSLREEFAEPDVAICPIFAKTIGEKMKKYKADITVTLKNGVRDPQGAAIDTVLKRTGVEESAEVQTGKFFTLSVTGENEAKAKIKLDAICEEVLSNPVLESYKIERFAEV